MVTSQETPKALRALDPFVHPQLEDFLHQDTKFVDNFHALLTEVVEPPFAISVDGLWGSGKTTIMKMLQNRLDAGWRITGETLEILKEAGVDSTVLGRLQEMKARPCYKEKKEFIQVLEALLGPAHLEKYQEDILEKAKITEPRFPTFWFNPWEYQKADDIVLAFLQQFAKQVYSRYEQVAIEGAKILCVVGLLGIDLTFQIMNALVKSAAGIESDMSLSKIKDVGELLEKDWNTTYGNYDDVMSTIKKEFRELIKWISMKHDGNPVIIFFDDLDRCLPDTTIQLLEAVKNLFVIPNTNVMFVCGIDTHIAKQFISAHYKDIEESFAINYFRKIFNLTISMPSGDGPLTLLQQHIDEIPDWNTEFESLDLANMIVMSGIQAEMGSVRKYLNVVNSFYAFCRFNPDYPFTKDDDLVVSLLILKEAWQPLYEELTQEALKNSLDAIKDLVPEVIKSYKDREKPLQPPQIRYLEDHLVKPFGSKKLGTDVLFEYPTLA